MTLRSLGAAALFALALVGAAEAQPHHRLAHYDISDAALVRSLPGFRNEVATVDGIKIHYVVGGQGEPLFLLPGWPETWWAYHKVMPTLATTHRVISVDLRGMGRSDKPQGGYDKKTMASDIAALAAQLGYGKVDVVGHDIGAMVAFSLAENHPELVRRLVLLDVAHPTAAYFNLKLLPEPGALSDKVDPQHPYFWWFAFHQIKGLPEQLLEGRAGIEQTWFFHYMTRDERTIDARDRAVYAAAYSTRDGTRGGDGWYQAFAQDIADDATYGPLRMPVLGLGGQGYTRLKTLLDAQAPDSRTFRVEGAGHFIAEEKPEVLLAYLAKFLTPSTDARP